MKIIFYLSVHTEKPKFVAILTPVAKQWIAKDIQRYESQPKRENCYSLIVNTN